MKHSIHYQFLFLIALVALVTGCGGPTKLPAQGAVTFDGQAIEKGTIIFIPQKTDLPQSVAKIEAGRYVSQGTEGVRPGLYEIRITGYRSTGKKVAASPLSEESTMDVIEQFIPAKYNSKSTLTVTIVDEKFEYDFHLVSQD